MPGKKKGKKGKGKKKKVKLVGNEMPSTIVKRLLKTYERNCIESGTVLCPGLKSMMKAYVEEDNLLAKMIIEPLPQAEGDDIVADKVSIEPLVAAIRQERYIFLKHFFIWRLPLSQENCATLGLLLEKGFYPIQHLEVMDCLLDTYAAARLAKSFNLCQSLSTIVLDYNEFGDAGCLGVCEGLMDNVTVISLSMCYCCLTKESGKPLGHTAATTAVREFYLDGNDLESEGTMDLIKVCVDKAQKETYEREQEAVRKAEEAVMLAEQQDGYRPSDTDGSKPGSAKKKKKGKKKKKAKGPPPPPPVGPWIYKLHLADNGIDALNGSLAPLICMRLFNQLLTHSSVIEELDLEDNLIGDTGGRELMEGLFCRKEAGLNGVKLRATHRLNADTFNTLLKLGAGLKKKKKKGRKKKKK